MVSMRNKQNYLSIIIKCPFLSRALDLISESYLIQRSKQELMQVDKTLFSEERLVAGTFIRINTVCV